MRHAGRSRLSDTFYQNFELGSWQQRNVTKFLQNKELLHEILGELNGYYVQGKKNETQFIIDGDL